MSGRDEWTPPKPRQSRRKRATVNEMALLSLYVRRDMHAAAMMGSEAVTILKGHLEAARREMDRRPGRIAWHYAKEDPGDSIDMAIEFFSDLKEQYES